MKKVVVSLLCVICLSYAVDYNADEAQMLSLSCVSCHGPDGKSKTITPYIAGKGKVTLYKALLDYKYDKKEGTIMSKHAKGFSDEELEQIAYYFSSIKR